MSADAESSLPAPPDPEVVLLLQAVWDLLIVGADWPTYDQVERLLHHQHHLNIDALVARTSTELLLGGRPEGGASPRGDGQLALRLLGARACTGTEAAIAVVVTAARLAAAAEAAMSPTEEHPWLTFGKAAVEAGFKVGVDAAVEAALARQSGLLLQSEPWTEGISRSEASWQIEVTRRARPFVAVQNLAEYWAARKQGPGITAPSSAGLQPTTALPTLAGVRAGIPSKEDREMTEAAGAHPDPRQVFVIHGRNEPARAGLFAFLRAIGLRPIEWSQALALTGKASPYIGEVLDAAFDAAQAIVVLETPDDIAYLHPSLTYSGDPECDAQPQPRPNVLFEAGMAMGRDPNRTVIVELGRIRVFSDIHGRHVVRLDNSVGRRQDLAGRLRTAGCEVDLTGRDWHDAGNLEPPPPPGGGLPLGRKLPSRQASGTPRLDARYHDSSRSSGYVEVINHGPGDVYELDYEADDSHGLHAQPNGDFPIPRLPAGKSVKIMRTMTLDQSPSSYFNLRVTGKTVDGTPIDDEIFVSMS
jgi:predicted nucleotide-binding protein